MLLTIVLGAVAALLVFPHVTIWEAGILAAILAPTDAGLGQVIVNSPRVPLRIRQALNVEAGLNDGLSVPFLLFFIALATAGGEGGTASLMRFILDQLGLGVLVGVAIGLAGGWLLAHADRKEWMAELVPTGRPDCAAGVMPAGVRNGGREHVHCCVRRRPGGADRLQGCKRAQPRVRGRMGTSVESFRVLPLRPVGGATMAADRRGGGAVRGAQPDRRADIAGRDRARRRAAEHADSYFHGLVRPARAGIYCSRAGLSAAGSEFAGGVDDQTCRHGDRADQHLRPWAERSPRH